MANEYINRFLTVTSDFLLGLANYADSVNVIITDYLTAEPDPEPPVEPEPEPPIEPDPEPPIEPEPEPDVSYFDTTYPPATDSKTVYVSASEGTDFNTGLTPDSPVQSIGMGLSLMRNGYPDRLLFKRGDTWVGDTFGNFTLSGRSADEPMVFGSYGDVGLPRPKFNTLHKHGVNTYARGNPPRDPKTLDHLAFVGLHFYAGARDPNSPDYVNEDISATGFRWLQGTQGLTIDDCKFEFYHTNIVIQSYLGTVIENVTIKNCVLLDAYSYSPNDGHSQGIYTDGVNGLDITDCIIDHNGHNDVAETSKPTIYNHNLYLQKTCRNVSVRNNIITRASSHGLQLRPGGIARDNFFFQNPINILIGYDMPHVDADVGHNVVAEGTNISESLPRCWGIEFHSSNPSGPEVHNNIVVNAIASSPNSRSIEDRSNVAYHGNIVYNWPPEGPFDDPDEVYSNPDVTINSDELFAKMREYSMDNQNLSVFYYLGLYRGAFSPAPL